MTREEWLELGCLDTPEQVAECISCPLPDCVNCQSRGGPSARARGRHTWDRKLARKLWEAGRMDSEIARSVGCTTETVLNWRKREGLRSNYRRGRPREQVQEPQDRAQRHIVRQPEGGGSV